MLDELKEVINPDIIIPYDDTNRRLLIKEDGADSKLKKLYIDYVPVNSLAFTLDHQPGGHENLRFKQLSSYVNIANNKGVNKGCDLVIVWKDEELEQINVLIFDLKSDKPKASETKKQLNNSEVFVKYLLEMTAVHYSLNLGKVKFKQAIATTDSRALRKGVTYRPSQPERSTRSYTIESVTNKQNQTGRVAFPRLVR